MIYAIGTYGKFEEMDKRLTRFGSCSEMKRAELRAWQELPASERIRVVMEINSEFDSLKGRGSEVPKLDRTLFRGLERPSG